MPHYDFECTNCSYTFEEFQMMSDDKLEICPNCKNKNLIRLIGIGSAAIVKGTKTPCRGGRGKQAERKDVPKQTETPPWRDGPIDKKVLKNPEKYIQTGEID